jgi:putative sigma-54 modulation protein
MNTEVTTRHFELSDSLKQRTEERLNKLQRFFDRILDARVVVSFEKNRYDAEATLIANGTPITSHAEGETDRAALEQALDKLEVQIRRHKDRLTRQKRRVGAERKEAVVQAEAEAVAEAEEESAFDEMDLDGLVSEDAGDWAIRMPVAEAAAQLRVSAREVLGFTNPETSRPALVFKRRDGSVGVVDIKHRAGS